MKFSEKDIARLALFPEQNPNPVLEADLRTGTITYMNPAARQRFPELEEGHEGHPLFAEIKKKLSLRKDFKCEVVVEGCFFEQKIYFLPDSDLIRVYSHDITEMKQIEKNLSRLASFPEQNPTPIIEVSLNGDITYFNPAFLIHFPDFYERKLEHPALLAIRNSLEKYRSGELREGSTEIRLGQKYYEQRHRLLHDSGVVRMFSIDITLQKQNEEIIREKNKDITDSINYARKIQQSILPSEEILLRNYPDSFVLYRPKDIISGDFYWYADIGAYLLFACADCTGHGVPGALMSMIGSNFITHIVNEKEITTPDGALMELDKRVRKALRQDEEPESKDGMDIAFCALQKEKRVLHYAGANRPLVLVRNGELREYAPSKFPIGGQFNADKKFEDNKLLLEKGDCIYLFTDGIADQFGGPKGKKFMKKRFYELLQRICSLPMSGQKSSILVAFEDWKGQLEQVDDVLVMGIRI
ncbi:MAG: SpoIIE family protein phosphatase [Bacteroidota bacterium]